MACVLKELEDLCEDTRSYMETWQAHLYGGEGCEGGREASAMTDVQSILTRDRGMLKIGFEMQLWNNCASLLIPLFAM